MTPCIKWMNYVRHNFKIHVFSGRIFNVLSKGHVDKLCTIYSVNILSSSFCYNRCVKKKNHQDYCCVLYSLSVRVHTRG